MPPGHGVVSQTRKHELTVLFEAMQSAGSPWRPSGQSNGPLQGTAQEQASQYGVPSEPQELTPPV